MYSHTICKAEKKTDVIIISYRGATDLIKFKVRSKSLFAGLSQYELAVQQIKDSVGILLLHRSA